MFQETTSLVLVMRYSRIAGKTEDGKEPVRYLSSTAVVCAEVIKLITCVIIIWYQQGISIFIRYMIIKVIIDLNKKIVRLMDL